MKAQYCTKFIQILFIMNEIKTNYLRPQAYSDSP